MIAGVTPDSELLDYAIVTKEGDTDSKRSVIVDISLGGLHCDLANRLSLAQSIH
ncbi:MAG: hypothetical protein R2688_03800 [Fimbriimonadaceae bacterium]